MVLARVKTAGGHEAIHSLRFCTIMKFNSKSGESQMDENELDQPAVVMYWPQIEEAAQPEV